MTEAFVTLFVIVDPPGTIPIFMSLTNSMTAKQKSHAARTAVIVAVLVIGMFAIFGQFILGYMHISLEALQTSGGLLLLLIALQLVTGKEEEMQATNGVNVALVPLGTPLLAGPGAIVAVMLYVQRANGELPKLGGIVLACVGLAICMYLFMRFSGFIAGILRQGGVTLVTRIAGVLLAAISVQMISNGVHTFLISWGALPPVAN
ncbi:MarC family protein [Dermabacteraceae bacterium TAE3-ERU27]|nr:MarC family protein [Dermabacteraceae bacterium TAE3-ERU27]